MLFSSLLVVVVTGVVFPRLDSITASMLEVFSLSLVLVLW